jgi:hypothetical protein
MIKRILIAIAIFVTPIATATVAGVVASPGVAGAATPAPTTINCSLGGTVTFATPGLSAGGVITNKTVEDTASSTTAAGTNCPTTTNALKIPSATTLCPETGGVPTSTDPAACLASTTKNGVVTYAIAKDPYYYDTDGSYASTGLTDLDAALSAKPIKATVDGIATDMVFVSASEVYPTALGGSGLCGTSDVGFDVTGNVQVKDLTVGTYTELVCLSSDTGVGTSGSFLTDLGSSTALIQTAVVGGDSSLTIVIPTASCSLSGTVTFASPGLSAAGVITNKTVEDTVSSTTAAGTNCPTTTNALKIPSATTLCPETGGVPTSTDPAACLASTTKNGVVTYAIAKDPYYYDTGGSYATSGLTALEAALAAKPIKATVDSIATDLVFVSASEVYPTALGGSGLCGASDAGFDVTGNVQVKDVNVGTYTELACLSSDTGVGTSGSFLTDLGSSTALIQTAVVGGDSSLTITF